MTKEPQSSKNTVFLSLIGGALVLVVLLVFQASNTGVSSVLLPSDLVGLKGEERTRLRVAGRVAEGSIDYEVEPAFMLRFSIQNPGKEADIAFTGSVPVVYSGIKPDMFAVGRDVILDGTWKSDTFIASKLMTQCPSKYEAPLPPGAKHEAATVGYNETSTE
jgi:cytochrome c-type biogenesis protein CcmE